jgi:hypothetical protein
VSVYAVSEHRRPAAEQDRDDVDADLVDESEGEVLPAHVGATHDGDIGVAGGCPRLVEGASGPSVTKVPPVSARPQTIPRPAQ